jgi:hypothetical protein
MSGRENGYSRRTAEIEIIVGAFCLFEIPDIQYKVPILNHFCRYVSDIFCIFGFSKIDPLGMIYAYPDDGIRMIRI